MANGVVGQFAVFVALAGILLCLIIVFRRRRTRHEQARMLPDVRAIVPSQSRQLQLVQTAISVRPPDAQPQVPQMITLEPVSESAVDAKPPIVVHAQPVTIQEDRNQRILAGISENIRKSNQTRLVTTYSPIHYSEKPRDTEYVRVKKQIITPHGQVRFSILKDSISTNMFAIFRRASLDWKTPEDLIGFLPSYLEAEAEILDHGLLLIGTPGHNEKLAVPIRSVDATSSFRDCFDFVSDVRTATNTPAVLLQSVSDFEIVSRGVISTAFMHPADGGEEVNLLTDRFSGTLQKSYAVALPRT
jgi:hypothetical protein